MPLPTTALVWIRRQEAIHQEVAFLRPAGITFVKKHSLVGETSSTYLVGRRECQTKGTKREADATRRFHPPAMCSNFDGDDHYPHHHYHQHKDLKKKKEEKETKELSSLLLPGGMVLRKVVRNIGILLDESHLSCHLWSRWTSHASPLLSWLRLRR